MDFHENWFRSSSQTNVGQAWISWKSQYKPYYILEHKWNFALIAMLFCLIWMQFSTGNPWVSIKWLNFMKIGTLKFTLTCINEFYLHFSHLLFNMDKILYKMFALNAVEHLWVSVNSEHGGPYFCYRSKWNCFEIFVVRGFYAALIGSF